MDELSSAERRALRARAHNLRPVVMIGDAGLTPQVIREVDANLKSHELIKIRVLEDGREARETLLASICEETGAQPVQTIGKILVVYRQKPPEEQAAAKPRSRRRREKRRTKRSYQNR